MSAAVAQRTAAPVVTAMWLGQAGFLFQWVEAAGGVLDEEGQVAEDVLRGLLIDPYLSDSLARKYEGTVYPHTRLLQPPVGPDQLPPLTAVLSTHAHTDHMDPDTLQPLLARDPQAVFVAPAGVAEQALKRSGLAADGVGIDGESEARLRLLQAGQTIEVAGLRISAVPSAHETLEVDEAGNHKFLGYVVELPGVTIYHSGDCVPFEGQAEWLRGRGIDVAFLPVNGRDAERLGNGVPGNFTFDEAVDLCRAAGIRRMVAHHWGMFGFNTADPGGFDLESAVRRDVDVVVPVHAEVLTVKGDSA